MDAKQINLCQSVVTLSPTTMLQRFDNGAKRDNSLVLNGIRV